MNEKILELFLSRPDLQIGEKEQELLYKFFTYLDRNSLWLRFYEPGDDPVFLVSDDTMRYRLPLSQIHEMWAELKKGNAIEWDKLPYEYVRGSDAR